MAFRSLALDRKYHFEYDVGLWAFGTVQVVRDRKTDQLKMCKTVRKELIRNPDAMARLQRLRELQHDHICALTDIVEDSARIHVIYDKCQGGDLAEWIIRVQEEGNWLQEQTVAEYMRQTLIALAHAHGTRASHRDLRPSSLFLSSKLPDAKVLVADLGLCEILDPQDEVTIAMQNPYAAPELGSGLTQTWVPLGPAADMWSVGAIAHQLLVGSPPQREDRSSGPWSALGQSGRATDREAADAWDNRTELSRDFVRRLLRQQAQERPTAATALQHPWIQMCFSLDLDHWHPSAEGLPDLRNRLLCYILSVVMLPAVMQYRDLFQLRSAFASFDTDRDGFIPKALAHRILKERGANASDAAAALDAVDVRRTGVVNLCVLFVACVIAQFYCGGEGSDTRMRRPGDFAQKLTSGFFQIFGDAQRMVASVPGVKSKMSSVVVREVEMHASVRYDELLDWFPEEDVFNAEALTSSIFDCQGRGTPLACEELGDESHESEHSWGEALGEVLGLGRMQDVVRTVFRTCGLSGVGGHCDARCEVVSMQTAFSAPPGKDDHGYRRLNTPGGQ
mmetsp:Transcript_71013/g.205878  ORF Transcript_71013/g.205878 Transcript_71013/m.205878 type:complete len:564 (-) Transcript_71013:191-1882(-)